MFRKAQIKLTILYSILFLFLFWLFSFGIYTWMNSSFGEGYISQVQQRQGGESDAYTKKNSTVVTIAGDVALDQLLKILLTLNSGLLLIIPVTSWFLAKRTLSPVQKIHELQKQFVSDASHELRTPLSIMSGELEVTLKKDRSVSEYKHVMTSTKEEVTRLTTLVENLLFLAREDERKQAVAFSSVDITDIISSIIAIYQPQIDEKKIHIIFLPTQISTTVRGNEGMLRQLFRNLLDNAIKYTPIRGSIHIECKKKTNQLIITIEDSGPGISKADQEKIFDRFYRVDTSRSQTNGYGLGLAISRVIVKRHNGKISIASPVGKGSVFTVEIPLV